MNQGVVYGVLIRKMKTGAIIQKSMEIVHGVKLSAMEMPTAVRLNAADVIAAGGKLAGVVLLPPQSTVMKLVERVRKYILY